MIEVSPPQAPTIADLRDDARAIARLRVYGDDCVLMGWTGDYRSEAPVAVFLGRADEGGVPHPQAVTILLEETQGQLADWQMKYAGGAPENLAGFLSVTCPALADRFPDILVADGDEPVTPEQFQARMLTFTIRLSSSAVPGPAGLEGQQLSPQTSHQRRNRLW